MQDARSSTVVCVVECVWYRPIQVRSPAYPDTIANAFLCGLQDADVLYRVLMGNPPREYLWYTSYEICVVDANGNPNPCRLRLMLELKKSFLTGRHPLRSEFGNVNGSQITCQHCKDEVHRSRRPPQLCCCFRPCQECCSHFCCPDGIRERARSDRPNRILRSFGTFHQH